MLPKDDKQGDVPESTPLKKIGDYGENLMPAINNILITSAGRRVSLLRNFRETLRKLYPEGKVFAMDMSPHLSAACMDADEYVKAPRVTDPCYLMYLEEFCLRQKINLVVPTIDTELTILAEAREKFAHKGIKLAVSSPEVCATFFLKSSTEAFFVNSGFDTPRIITDLAQASYPIFAKKNNSSCSIGAGMVETYEASQALQIKDSDYVFQELICGDEYTVDCFVDSRGKVLSVVPRKRLEVRDGEVSKALACKDREIIEQVCILAEKIPGAYGTLTIQVIKTLEGRLVFIEINPRFGGGYPLSWKAGADFAEYLIKDMLDEEQYYSEEWRDQTLMLRYDAEVIIHGCCI